MKLLIAASSFASSVSGVQRHALNMVRCLLLLKEIEEIRLAVAPWQAAMVDAAGLPNDHRVQTYTANIDRGSMSRNIWHYRQLPRLAEQLRVDLVHFSYPMPVNAQAFPCPTIVTLHDLYPYEIPMNFGFPKYLFNRAILRQCLRATNAIACVSESTLMRLKQYAPASVWKKAVRIYNCVEPETRLASESPIPGWKGERFLLCIAQHRRNKNIPTLLRAFNHLRRSEWIEFNARLVVIGLRGPETARILRLVRELGLGENVHFLAGLSEADLQWCYRHCGVLVSPSITEGFDLPVAEGLLSGCRIVCSDIPAHREIGDARCRFVAMRDHVPQTLAAEIVDSLEEPKPQPIALPQFSASALAAQYLALYQNLIASAKQAPTLTTALASGSAVSEATSIAVPDGQSALACRGE